MKKTYIFFVMLMALSIGLMAQDAPVFDGGTVDNIMDYSLMGLSIAGVTEALKRILKLTGTPAKILWAVVCVAFTGVYIWQTGMFSVLNLVIYSVAVILSSFGIYKFSKAPSA